MGCRARPLGTGLRRHDGGGEVGCWLGMTVVWVAAPVPWVPAFAGTTVVGKWGVGWG